MVTDQKYEVTGELDPDAAGTYEPIGPYNGKSSYKLAGNGWSLWWNGVDAWIISTIRGTEGVNYWLHVGVEIEGDYTPEGPNTGDATVTVI